MGPSISELASFQDSIGVITQLLEETILQRGAEFLYDRYLLPKVMPYTALQTIELTAQQVHVSSHQSSLAWVPNKAANSALCSKVSSNTTIVKPKKPKESRSSTSGMTMRSL